MAVFFGPALGKEKVLKSVSVWVCLYVDWLQLKLKECISSHLVSVFVKRSFYLEFVRKIEKNLFHGGTELEHLILDKQPSLGFLKHSINPP